MPVGGGFGGKVEFLEPLLALIALRLRRPVRLALARSHEFVYGRPAPAARFEIELGARRDGTLLALRVRFHYDNGATAGWHAGLTANFLGGSSNFRTNLLIEPGVKHLRNLLGRFQAARDCLVHEFHGIEFLSL